MDALRRHRRSVVGWLAAVLLLAQLATSAYACPLAAPPAPEVAMAGAGMPGCSGNMPSGLDPDQPQLCKAHCDADATSVNTQASPLDAPPAVAVGAALVGTVAADAAALLAAAMPAGVAHGPPDGAPPLYLSLLVLRN